MVNRYDVILRFSHIFPFFLDESEHVAFADERVVTHENDEGDTVLSSHQGLIARDLQNSECTAQRVQELVVKGS